MPSYKAGSGAPAYVDEGTYDFEVVEAKEKIASSGNDMIALVLEVAGGTRVYDNLVFHPKAFWRIDEFRTAIGQEVVEEDVDFEAEDCLGAIGRVKLKLGESNTGKTRNEVLQYLPKEAERPTKAATTPPAKSKAKNPDLDAEPDDIPF